MNDETEVGPIKKFDISIPARDNQLKSKVLNLKVGDGFEVKGRDRAELAYYQTVSKDAGISVTIRKIGQLHYAVIRYA